MNNYSSNLVGFIKAVGIEKQAASLASGIRKYIQALRQRSASSVPIAEAIDPNILKSFIPDLSKAKQVKIPSSFAKNTPASSKLDAWNAGKGIDL